MTTVPLPTPGIEFEGRASAAESAADATTLTTEQRDRLLTHEQVIEQGIKTFLDVGRALVAIRDERLYRETHRTFESYCRDRWGIGRAHAYRLVDAAGIVEVLSPTGDIPDLNERQLRELAPLRDNAEAMRWALDRAKAIAGGARWTTAEHVRAAVAELRRPDSGHDDEVPGDLLTARAWLAALHHRCTFAGLPPVPPLPDDDETVRIVATAHALQVAARDWLRHGRYRQAPAFFDDGRVEPNSVRQARWERLTDLAAGEFLEWCDQAGIVPGETFAPVLTYPGADDLGLDLTAEDAGKAARGRFWAWWLSPAELSGLASTAP